MIKVYCDRCEKEISGEEEPMGIFQALTNAIDNLLGNNNQEFRFVLYKENGTAHPDKMTLCKDCDSALQIFMKAMRDER